jgi:hypothetical protein
MRGRALGLVSRGAVDAMERFYEEAAIAPSTKRVQGAKLLFYRARLRALLQRRAELKSLALETEAPAKGIIVSPKGIPEDFAREVSARQLRTGAKGVGLAAVIAAIFGGPYLLVGDLSYWVIPLLSSAPITMILSAWISMHRGILTERF